MFTCFRYLHPRRLQRFHPLSFSNGFHTTYLASNNDRFNIHSSHPSDRLRNGQRVLSTRAPQHEWGDKRSWTSIILTTAGISGFIGFALWFRWYTNRKPDYEELRRDARKRLSESSRLTSSTGDETHLQLADRSDLESSPASSSSTVGDTIVKETVIAVEAEPRENTNEKPESSPTNYEGPQVIYIDPSKVQFPSHVPYLIVGAGTAGISAARAIRASDGQSKIMMVAGGCGSEPGSEPGINETDFVEPPPYLRPPLSKELWRRTKAREQKVLQTTGDIRRHSWLYYEADCFFLKPEFLPAVEYGGVALLRGDPVVHLDADKHVATLASGRTITYDRCLIATGGTPKRLKHLEVCEATKTNLTEAGLVSYFRTLADYKRLREWVDSHRKTGAKVAIIGGGFLASELTVGLLTQPSDSNKNVGDAATKSDKDPATAMKDNLAVSHIFRESSPLGHVLPPCLSSATGRYEASKGAELWPSSEVVSISLVPEPVPTPIKTGTKKDGKRTFSNVQTVIASGTTAQKVRLRIRSSGIEGSKVEDVDFDHVIIAAGIEANTQLAESAGLEVDPVNGGFLVNAEFEARAGIFVAGDAASYWDPVLGFRRRVEHLNFAEETGTLAGKNMALVQPDSGLSGASYEPIRYQYQSSLWSSLGPSLSWDAVGHVDSKKLLTRSFFVSEEAGLKTDESINNENHTIQSIPQAEFGRLGRGVVFYFTPKEKRLVGILLWNLPEDLYSDQEYAAPSRLNIARGLLAKRLCIGKSQDQTEDEELRHLASIFDLNGELEQDYAELKAYTEAKRQELSKSTEQEVTPAESAEKQ